MKRFTLLAAMIATAFAVKAQDLIVLRNATEIQSKVVAITPESVSYKRSSNLEGPTYTIARSEVFYIKYQNGEKDVLTDMSATPTKTYSASANRAATSASPISFRGHLMLGTIFDKLGGGPTVDLSVGAMFYEHVYMGVELGFHTIFYPLSYIYESDGRMYQYKGVEFYGYVPIGVNMKGYLTKGKKVNPYINCSLGGFLGVDLLKGFNGFYCQVGAGFEAKRFLFGIGYSGLVKYGVSADCGYVKLGVRFGK